MAERITRFAVNHPVAIMVACGLMVIGALFQFPKIDIDTDPENMLSSNESVRVFHHEVKKEFSLHDFIIVGVINEKHRQGVFNPDTLSKIYAITKKAETIEGVIARDIISPSTKDNITQAGLGAVRFEWLMKKPPATQGEADRIKMALMENPLYYGTVVSEDGRALCMYVPIQSKDMSYRISREIAGYAETLSGDEEYHITGLPVAEDTFGFEMFKQMAISAPLAGLIIFLLLLFFFRKANLILSPMIVAMVTVIGTMGALIGGGYTVHIMSSMIPIFLMPISVVDSVHILSDFFDSYQKKGDRKKTIIYVMNHLFMPMLYTSLTTAAGFFSLAFTPIPPVQVFGIFVGLGVMFAWLLTVLFIPAYTVLLPDRTLADFGARPKDKDSKEIHHGLLGDMLERAGRFATTRYKPVIAGALIIVVISIYGIGRIEVNDNPVRWFTPKHPIRVADTILNRHFGGTYTAYLVLEAQDEDTFKEPEVLRYVEQLQHFLLSTKAVGKATSLADAVKKIHYELMEGDKTYNRIPDTRPAVAQCLISFQNSHKPDDLWHLVTPDYTKAVIWVQLKSGDNKDMNFVTTQVKNYFREHAPPVPLTYNWAGLTYINVVWQEKMVAGMLRSLLGSFAMVFLMMVFLFRSPLWGLLSMTPLSLTILSIYGLIGIVGKDYDMPVAVLSALTLGLSVDFAIHFLERTRQIYASRHSWEETSREMFQESARAITRNAVVIAIGFLPLLAAPLIPYKTVGFFMAAIMAVSGLATLLLLPSLISWLKVSLFEEKQFSICSCPNCIIISLTTAGIIAFLLHGLHLADMRTTTFIAIGVVVLLIACCNRISKTAFCTVERKKEKTHE
ncbi:MAG: MMPL family transporter [Candidatus Omnitrophica bacterium]|nr:MMPL family transporter [Candidatus Omnitrophota bacterium]